MSLADSKKGRRQAPGQDWSTWPQYEAAELGLRGYWYPIAWAREVGKRPHPVTLLGERIVLLRNGDRINALHDRCPHRGVPLSAGRRQFPGTISCAYHGWTFDSATGDLVAVLTDGPESPICGKVSVATYPVEQRLGLVWVFIGEGEPPPVEREIPDELLEHDLVMGGKMDIRQGNWRLAAENGFDEGHAKYLHNTALWRLFKVMPAWNETHLEQCGGWLVRVQDQVHWEGDYPAVGYWSNKRWWRRMPLPDAPGKSSKANAVIASLDIPGFVSIRLPGLLRVAYPNFIHYEWYVPVDEKHVKYVQVMVQYERGLGALAFKAKYLAAIRWLFHGQFTGQDSWMVGVTDAPPERLYRPDVSITGWRKLVERSTPTLQTKHNARWGLLKQG